MSADTALNVREFGAKGDGVTKDTKAIQAAIDRAAQVGGTVTVPPGKYISGTLHLATNVTFRLERGSILAFSPDDADFDEFEQLPYQMPADASQKPPTQSGAASPIQARRNAAPRAWDDTETSYAHYALLSGDSVNHIAIEGDGEIDGNRPRRGGPKPIAIRNSQWVSIRGITIRNAPNYNISLMGSDYIEVDAVKLINGFADGVDPDNCHYVRITNSYIDTWDDAICPKASMALGKPRGTEDLVVANCILRTNSNNFKFGTETEGDLKNVSVTNCVMLARDTGRHARAGISIESVDGANVDGVVISNISMQDPIAPIFIRLGNRARGMEKPAPGTLKNVSISNVVASGASLASSITGLDEAKVENVTIDGFDVTIAGGGAEHDLNVPEVVAKYPESNMFGELPGSALYGRHVVGLTLKNVSVHTRQPDTRPLLVFDDVARAEISGFKTSFVPANNPVLLFRNVVDSLLYGNRITHRGGVFLRVTGEKSQDVALRANDLGSGQKAVEIAPEVPKHEVSTDDRGALDESTQIPR